MLEGALNSSPGSIIYWVSVLEQALYLTPYPFKTTCSTKWEKLSFCYICCKYWVIFWHEQYHTEGLTCGRCIINANCISEWFSIHRTETQVQATQASILRSIPSELMPKVNFHSPRCLPSVASPHKASILFTLLASYWFLVLSQLNCPEPSFLPGEQGEDSLTEELPCASSVLRE